MTAVQSLQKMIHVGCKQLGIDAETRHDLQQQVTGKASLSDMTEAELGRVVARLKQMGFQPFGPRAGMKGRGKPAAPRGDLRYVHVLWRLLCEAGVVTRPGRDGLNAFVRARFENTWDFVPIDIDALRDPVKINAVVRALKDWCHRSGVRTEQ